MKTKKLKKTIRYQLRMDKNEWTFLKNTAQVYANGNIAIWMRHCFMNYQIPREVLDEKKGPPYEGPQGDQCGKKSPMD